MEKDEVERYFPVGRRVYCDYMEGGPSYRSYKVLGKVEEIKDSILRVRSDEVPNTTLDYDFFLIHLSIHSPVMPAEMIIEHEKYKESS